MSPTLRGFGTAVPPHAITQPDAAKAAARFCCETDEQRRLLSVLFHRAGVGSRGSVVLERSNGPVDERQPFFASREEVGPDGPTTGRRMEAFTEHAGRLAVQAAASALGSAKLLPSQVTHLITVTCSGFSAPGFDIDLFRELPLPAGTSRTQLGFMGCHGALNALRVAHSYVRAEPSAVVLICCVELCSLHYQYRWQGELIVANSLFADGAAAMLITDLPHAQTASGPSNPEQSSSAFDGGGAWQIVGSGSCVIPGTEDAMSWRIGDHGFLMGLSPRVPEIISQQLRPWLTGWLKTHGLTLEGVSNWAVHPGGPRILSAVQQALDLSPSRLEHSMTVLREHGNMSSPTLVFILERILATGAEGPLVMLGFGPGLTIEAALLHPTQ